MFRKHLFHFVNWLSRTFFASRLSYAHIQAFIFNNSLKKITNLIHVHWDIWRGNTITTSKPYIFILETTNICNLRCPFCLTGKGITGGRELRHLTFTDAKLIIDQVADSIYLLQLYTWGEPLLNKDTIKIIEYAKKKNIYVMLSTNATAMTPAYNKQLLDAKIDYITVAIDGGSTKTYSQYRIGGNYTKVFENVKNLLEQRRDLSLNYPFVEWQFIVFRHNEHEVEKTELTAYNIGINKFTPLPAYVEDESWHPIGKQFKQDTYNPERLKNCERPWSHLNVRADGGVASCCYEFAKKDDFGDIYKQDFTALWNNSFFQEARLLIKQHKNGHPLGKSELICHDCIETGIRPSYAEVVDLPLDQLNMHKVKKNNDAPESNTTEKAYSNQ